MWFVEFFNKKPVPWNYRQGSRIARAAYKGLHNLPVLLAGVSHIKNKIGQGANAEMLRLAAPLAFERHTQVFDLSPRRFQFGPDRNAAYRIPFLFVEKGVIRVYFLQPRKGAGLDLDDFGMVGTVVKKYLLDVEFYGLKSDVEFVDVSAPEDGNVRLLRRYSLGDLKLWSDKRLADRLTLITQALDWAADSDLVEKRRRIIRRPEPEMPLFD